MSRSEFVYVTYIRTGVEQVWEALVQPEFMKQYWFGMYCESEWRAGASWKLVFADGRIADRGEIVEAHPPYRLVIRWRNEWQPEMQAEGDSLCSFEIEDVGTPGSPAAKLVITHTMDRAGSKLIHAVGGGWPKIVSNLKSLLEGGSPVLGGS
jgi:uncharacterized protein YndB with AHSA1/START domain